MEGLSDGVPAQETKYHIHGIDGGLAFLPIRLTQRSVRNFLLDSLYEKISDVENRKDERQRYVLENCLDNTAYIMYHNIMTIPEAVTVTPYLQRFTIYE